eukprot:GHVT01044970.1.p1 GENE.GHVT01044970.1~~GHVT01044970.1.p1  ORF type:complete len:291 (+),score=5.13 GHVT01044970.1:240-1112(+)
MASWIAQTTSGAVGSLRGRLQGESSRRLFGHQRMRLSHDSSLVPFGVILRVSTHTNRVGAFSLSQLPTGFREFCAGRFRCFADSHISSCTASPCRALFMDGNPRGLLRASPAVAWGPGAVLSVGVRRLTVTSTEIKDARGDHMESYWASASAPVYTNEEIQHWRAQFPNLQCYGDDDLRAWREAFNQYDNDYDNFITQADLQKVSTFSLEKERLFQDYHKDQIQIDFGEFVKAIITVDVMVMRRAFEGFDAVDIRLEFDKYAGQPYSRSIAVIHEHRKPTTTANGGEKKA